MFELHMGGGAAFEKFPILLEPKLSRSFFVVNIESSLKKTRAYR